ncbi:uncharacterized protein LOC115720739 [Cannabis sativa]|uniref:uncharacterized protein LOC115720739 n=1 Tax=Cannabis sativa TaxID=3483 RepID=UPI0029CA032A|nr:uncharacterized protein LOC115720739 [Cannabis sativa]
MEKKRGKNCAFLAHIGDDINSPEKAVADLMNQPTHIGRRFAYFTSQEIADNRLRLKTSIERIRWLAFQGCPFRGHNESKTSINQGNFLELLSFITSYNDKVAEVLDKALQNAIYTSPTTQKQVLHVLGNKVRNAIREEIVDAKFSVIVDEAQDESKKEKMSIILRFIDKYGYVQERFFGLIHVKDTAVLTLKEGIFSILSNYSLDVQSIRGKGYDGASNMCGQWNGLQALISSECPYAYYVHYFAHRLQLVLVVVSAEVILVHQFFTKLNSIVNIIGASYFSAHYTTKRGRSRGQQDAITVEHYYRVDLFNAVIDFQLQELNNKFNDSTMELLILSSALDPREMHTSFRIDDICKLVQKFYPKDFTEYEMWLVKTRKAEIFSIVYKVINLIPTLPVSTATIERSFSAMNIVKTTLCNKMEDEFLSDFVCGPHVRCIRAVNDSREEYGKRTGLGEGRDARGRESACNIRFPSIDDAAHLMGVKQILKRFYPPLKSIHPNR